jgi:regulator of replication initiation timing
MTSQWTDDRLNRFANKIDDFIESSREREQRLDERMNHQGDRIDNLVDQIGRLIEALYLEVPNLKAEIHSVALEANETRDVLHAELVELKEVAKQQAISAQTQAETAKTQAENIRLMIEMVNRKQA